MTTEQTQGQPETRPSEVRSDALLGYKIVSAHSDGGLESKVKNCIKAGFVPLGAPTAIGQYRGTLIQAMIHQPNVKGDGR